MKVYVIETMDYPEDRYTAGVAISPQAALIGLKEAARQDAIKYPSCSEYENWRIVEEDHCPGTNNEWHSIRIYADKINPSYPADKTRGWDLTEYEVFE